MDCGPTNQGGQKKNTRIFLIEKNFPNGLTENNKKTKKNMVLQLTYEMDLQQTAIRILNMNIS